MAAFVLRESTAGVPGVESSQGTNLRKVQKLANFCFVMRTSGHCNINVCSGSTLFCSEAFQYSVEWGREDPEIMT
ncbi:uncharacterized protein LOC118532617 isoform X2 [Halichoerus grypus]